jgi:hypothetical protein
MPNNTFSFGPDSRAALVVGTSGGITIENNTHIFWMCFLSGQHGQINAPNAVQIGVGGSDSNALVLRYQPGQGDAGVAALVLLPPTNDRGTSNLTAEQSIANYTNILTQAKKAGIKVGLLTDTPRGSVAFPGAALSGLQLENANKVRRWVLAQDDGVNVFVEDPYPFVTDQSSAQNYAKPGMLRDTDGLHMEPLGGYTVAKNGGVRLLQRLFPNQAYKPRSTNSDIFSASNQYGAINSNPTVKQLGTNGSPGGTGTGTIALGWTGTNASGASGVTRAYSFDTDGVQRCNLSGSASGTAAAIDILRQVLTVANLSPGDSYDIYCQVEIDANHVGLSSIQCGIESVDPIGGTLRFWDGDRYLGTTPYPPFAQQEVGTFHMRFVVPAGITSATLRLTAYAQDAAPTVTAGVRIKCFDIGKVQPANVF